jgi:hypothetical protein
MCTCVDFGKEKTGSCLPTADSVGIISNSSHLTVVDAFNHRHGIKSFSPVHRLWVDWPD